MGLETFALVLRSLVEREIEQRLAEAPGTGQVVSRELDQIDGQGTTIRIR